jgi:tetratricopeptide (TPR) repeat protein
MENDLAAIASRTERHASDARYRAEDLVYEAWEAAGPRRAVLARKALALWPECADGYVLLAQAASSLEEARELLERGVAAGERAVGRRVFVEDAGDFWLIFETRPYMRARAALAATLWRLGRREDAVEHQRVLLRLNPRDNQGLRYRQANWLLALECYDELEELFAAHAGDGNAPGFTYTRALAAFARRGAGTARPGPSSRGPRPTSVATRRAERGGGSLGGAQRAPADRVAHAARRAAAPTRRCRLEPGHPRSHGRRQPDPARAPDRRGGTGADGRTTR